MEAEEERERERLRAFAHLCVRIKVLCAKWGVGVLVCVRARGLCVHVPGYMCVL